jgi:hypothetical protein
MIADHFPAWCLPDVADTDPTALGVSTLLQLASLLVALELILLSWLTLTLVLPQQPPLDDHTKMHDVEMAFRTVGLLATAADSDCSSSPMDVDTEEKNTQAPMERCGGLVAAGLPFPGELLADGSFAVEYHDMYVSFFSPLFHGSDSHEGPVNTRRSGGINSSTSAPTTSLLALAT